VQALQALDWAEIVRNIQNFATSGAAKLALGEWRAFSRAEEARASVRDIQDATEVLQTGVRPFMESLDLFEPWYTRIKRNAVLKTLEIKDVRSFCLEALALRETALSVHNSWCERLAQNLLDPSEPISAIDQILTPSGDIRADASETLYRLFKEKENLARQIQNQLDRLVKAHEMANKLQDKYVTTREGRWVLPIKSGMQHFANGVIHGSSHTKQTVFMEPEEIIPINNRLRQCEVEIEDEIERLLTDLSHYLHGLSAGFAQAREWMVTADQLFAKAQWSLRIDAKDFSFTEEEILLNEVKHPLLVLAGKTVVANSVRLDQEKSILLLSGPNAGGKTVLLKSIGLAAQMARSGLPICAGENSQLPFFEKIQLGIGDSQSVDEELSTFAAHLKILDEAARLKGPHHLILIDEICGSTDPEEGSALGRAFIETFSKNEVFGVITSHLGPLKAGWSEQDHVLNGSLEYDAKSGRPTYQFLQGVPGDSLAIQTAKRVGVPREIIDRSVQLLSPETRTRLSGLEEIESMKSDINTLKEHLKKETQRAKFEKEKYEALRAKIEKEKEELLAKTIRQAERKIEDMISATKVEQTFKRHSALQEIKQTLPEIVKSKPGAGSSSGIDTADEFSKRYPPGSKVFVPSLNQDGLVQSMPNAKGEVQILSGSVRLTLSWQELKPAEKSGNPTASIVRRSGSNVGGALSVSLSDSDRTVDLRGQTVEDAVSALEIELDHAATQKEDRIKIIHGHGTEALKKAVRTYLSRSVYVKKWKAGSPEQGGDGVTWAELDGDN
jgi:DNA mismatch repair protein MutS2